MKKYQKALEKFKYLIETDGLKDPEKRKKLEKILDNLKKFDYIEIESFKNFLQDIIDLSRNVDKLNQIYFESTINEQEVLPLNAFFHQIRIVKKLVDRIDEEHERIFTIIEDNFD